MAERSGVEMVFDNAALPLYPAVRSLVDSGVRTGGEERNRTYLGPRLVAADPPSQSIILDPQTSGGLLASVDPSAVAELIDAHWWQIGEVREGEASVHLV
jgi:selenide,water dikinase